MEFHLKPHQIQLYREWSKKFQGIYSGVSGGAFTFSFTPTGLGLIIKVTHFQGEVLDLTEYDDW